MGTMAAEKLDEKEFSPKEIRDMLGIDNSKIQALCKFADIRLKRNDKGLTYFTEEDVEMLKAISNEKNLDKDLDLPAVNSSPENINTSSTARIIEILREIENSITDKVSNVLDEKLDGMDDVVMELIRVKSENETMRFKINELNKENYKLKKELNSFKKVPFGFYTKTTPDVNLF